MSVNARAFAGTLAMAVALLVAACDKERCEPAPRLPGLRISRPICVRRLRTASACRQAARILCVSVASRSGRRLSKTSLRYAGKPTYLVPAAIPTCCSSSSSPGMTPAMTPPAPSRPRPAWAARSPRRPRSTSILSRAAMRAADRRTSCMGRRRRCRQCQATRRQFSQVRHPPRPVRPPPRTAAQPQPSATAQAAPKSTPASGTAVMRQNGNIRIAPQGETIRVEPQGKELRVFGEAPGGWLQIGDTEANGWVHSSLVQRR